MKLVSDTTGLASTKLYKDEQNNGIVVKVLGDTMNWVADLESTAFWKYTYSTFEEIQE